MLHRPLALVIAAFLLATPCQLLAQDEPESEALESGIIEELTEEAGAENGALSIPYGGQFEGTVTTVSDAARLEIDGGPVELVGVRAPAGDECFAYESKAYVEARVLGKRVSYSVEGQNGDRRVLGYRRIYLYSGDLMLNSELIRAGMAFADRRPSYPEEEAFLELQAGARRRHAGLWRTCPVECDRFGDCSTKSW